MSDEIFEVATAFADVAELGQGFADRVDGERILLALPRAVGNGQEVRFIVCMADGTPAFAGAGRCIQVSDQGAQSAATERFETLLDSLVFDERSAPVYEYIVAVRQLASSEDSAVAGADAPEETVFEAEGRHAEVAAVTSRGSADAHEAEKDSFAPLDVVKPESSIPPVLSVPPEAAKPSIASSMPPPAVANSVPAPLSTGILTQPAESPRNTLALAPDVKRICDALVGEDEDDREEALDRLCTDERYDYSMLEPLLVAAVERERERELPARRAVLISALVACAVSRELRTGRASSAEIYVATDLAREHNLEVRFEVLLAFARFVSTHFPLQSHEHWGRFWQIGKSGQEIDALNDAIGARIAGSESTFVRELLSSLEPRERQAALKIMRVLPDRELITMALERFRHLSDNVHISTEATEVRLLLLAVTEHRAAEFAGDVLANDSSLFLVSAACGEASRLLLNRVAVKLLGQDQRSVQQKLGECKRAGGDVARGASRLLELLAEQSPSYIAGYATEVRDVSDDLELQSDNLRIALDVKTLCAVMLSKDVEPPLSIGLFGHWGTGKTFFMDCMQAETKRLGNIAPTLGKPSHFHTRVAQIRFNAWHYIDANLWASLVSHIIEKLAEEIRPKADAAAARKDLVNQMETAQELKREAADEKARATTARGEIQKELAKLASERAEKQVTLSDLRADDLWRVIRADPKVKDGLETAGKVLGVPTALSSLQELETVVREAHSAGGRLQALVLTVPKYITRAALLGMVLFLLVGVPVVAWALDLLLKQPWIAGVSALTAQFAAVGTALAAAVRTALPQVNGAIDRLGEVRTQALTLLESKRQERTTEEIALEKQINELGAKETSATQQLTAAEARIRELDAKIQEIDDGRSLSKYLLERFATEDYRRHLGLVSTIRRDFEKLAELVENAAKNANTEPIQRIVLYIDDLDRCPAPRVMEVLQAVHLLLAFKLFVVVVGVDPRWLLHALERSYSAFRGGNGRRSRKWQTTPQNYLEKIFQIPFSLRPMEKDGFATLIGSLLRETETRETHTRVAGESNQGEAKTLSAKTDYVSDASRPVVGELRAVGGHNAEASGHAATSVAPTIATPPNSLVRPKTLSPPRRPPLHLNYDALRIQLWERTYAERLHAFVPSPRAAKRFANVYRLLKARLDRNALLDFEGPDGETPGDFRAAMVLLAIATGFPNLASGLFDAVLKQVESANPDAWFAGLPSSLAPAADAARLKECVTALAGHLPASMQPFIRWVPRVQRFTFETALPS